MNFENSNIKAYRKKHFITILISAIIILISVILIYMDIKKHDNLSPLKDVMLEKKEGNLTYIDITNLSNAFAISNDTTNTYYFVYDGKYYYVAYMSKKQFNRLNKKEIKSEKIVGKATRTDDSIKNIVVDYYNMLISDDDANKLDIKDYDKLFGIYYIDMTNVYSKNEIIFIFMCFLFFIASSVMIIVSSIRYLLYIKNLNIN